MSVETTPDTQPVEVTVADYFSLESLEGAWKLREEIAKHLRNHARVVARFPRDAGYTGSFLDEAFGGLIRVEKLKKADIDEHLILQPDARVVNTYVGLAQMYIVRADKAVSSAA